MRFLSRAAAAAAICLLTASPGSGEQAWEYILLDGAYLKWGAPVAGSPAVVTYAVATSPRHFVDARNCPDVTSPDAMLRANGVERAVFDRELAAAFAQWSAVADIAFRRGDAATADILIGVQVDPKGRAFTNVEYGDVPPSPGRIRSLTRAVICLNPEQRWKTAFDGNLDVYDLRYTFLHEIGHAIGLDHPASREEVMGFRYSEAYRHLQPGDIGGAKGLYGASSPAIAAGNGKRGAAAPSSLALD